MPDYGHQGEFGYFLVPDAGDPQGVLETARLADRLGFSTLLLTTPPDPDMLRTYIKDVAPHVRERVAAARAQVTSGATLRQR